MNEKLLHFCYEKVANVDLTEKDTGSCLSETLVSTEVKNLLLNIRTQQN